MIDKKEKLNALEVALENEMREREFYLKNAQRTKNPLGKAMFQVIADEELEHFQKLKELQQKLNAEGKWPETIPLKVNETVVVNIFNNITKGVEEIPEGDADDREAIRKAIDFEAKATKYYAQLRDQVINPQEKRFFDLLAQVEYAHYLSLKDTEELLTDPVSWYQKKEHSHLNGG
ncbi:MAG: ferritin family protein [Desulfobacterota bacterium]|nr:ferritin family protein [Thermodesulfobacteriota bacterium]